MYSTTAVSESARSTNAPGSCVISSGTNPVALTGTNVTPASAAPFSASSATPSQAKNTFTSASDSTNANSRDLYSGFIGTTTPPAHRMP